MERRKQRYVYCTVLNSIGKVTGIIKFDLDAEPESGKNELEVGGNVSGIYDLGHGRFGSEAVLVPKEPGMSGEEDDGYLILFVHDENTGYSSHHYPQHHMLDCLRNMNYIFCAVAAGSLKLM